MALRELWSWLIDAVDAEYERRVRAASNIHVYAADHAHAPHAHEEATGDVAADHDGHIAEPAPEFTAPQLNHPHELHP